MITFQRKSALAVEALLLFGFFPLLPLTGLLPRPWFLFLYIAAIPAGVWLHHSAGSWRLSLWAPLTQKAERAELKPMLVRFVIAAVLLCALTLFTFPQDLLDLPLRRPDRWLILMVLYAALAVWPQELLYRAFFLRRYSRLAGRPWILWLFSGLAFGWAHMAYGNPIAVVLSAAGGVVFARTYERTGSLRLVCLEHVLYGCLVFTVGLGRSFYSGWAGPWP